ncbi:hypothetical protein DRJ22_05235, partial [Candidatus Woesearchaeota archaeon]
MTNNELYEGKKIDDFVLEKFIGSGTFGQVWEVSSIHTGLPKIAKFALNDNLSGILKEGLITQKLQHENIVRIERVCKNSEIPYLLMEYFEDAVNLRTKMKEYLTEEEKIRIIKQTAKALSYAHSKEIIHRDIKPENILVNDKLEVKVCDFGLAEIVSKSSIKNSLDKSKNGFTGTLGYASSEQSNGEPPRITDDIYSLNIVFFELITGEKLKIRETLADFKEKAKKRKINKKLVRIIEKNLDKKYYKRSQSMTEFIKEIDTYTCKIKNKKNKKSIIKKIILTGATLIAGTLLERGINYCINNLEKQKPYVKQAVSSKEEDKPNKTKKALKETQTSLDEKDAQLSKPE